MNNDLKSSDALKAYAREVLCGNNPTNSLLIRMFDEIIDNAPSPWIPVTYRPMTEEEEKEFCEEHDIEEGSLEGWEKRVFTCHLPDDGQEILISVGRYVHEDICSWDEDCCGLENNGDWDGVDAWMPKPEPYKKEGTENG